MITLNKMFFSYDVLEIFFRISASLLLLKCIYKKLSAQKLVIIHIPI